MTRFVINGDDLNDAAAWAARLCPAKPAVPILQGVLVDADDRLTLSAYDLDVSGTVVVSAAVMEPGRALIPGRLLAAVAKTCARDAEVVFDCQPSGVSVRAGRNSWTLPALPVEDYPALPVPGEAVAKLDGAALRRALDRVLPAADRSGSVRFNSSVAVVGDESGLTICATDAFRLAVATIPWDPTGGSLDVLAPVDFLDAALRAVGPESEPVELSSDGRVIALASSSHRLTGRLTAADWPRWRNLLPTSHVAEATFVVGELAGAIDRALAVADDKSPILLTVAKDGFELSVYGDDRAGHAVAPMSDYDGDPREIGINPHFLRDALDTLGTDLAVIRFGASYKAPLDILPLNADGEPDPAYRHLLMPFHPDKVRRAA